MKYIKSLDGVRAVAIILVMLFHFNYILEVGWIGVQLFFVLSGYLITTILLEAKEKSDSIGNYLKVFYWRRTLRIFPLYYLYLVLVLVAFLLFGKPANFPALIPFLASYSYNYYPLLNGFEFDYFFTHFWSLCVEEQFYLIWPFVIYLANPKQLKVILIFIILGTPIFRFAMGEVLLDGSLSSGDLGEVIYRLLPSQIDSLSFGALIPIFSLTKRKLPFSWIFAVSFLLFLGIGMLNWATIMDGYSLSSIGFPIANMHNYAHVWSYTIIGMVSMTLILFVITSSTTNWFNKLMSSQILISIGKVSYGMYLYHLILIPVYRSTLGKYFTSDILSFILYTVITYIVSVISYRLFESRFIKLKDRLRIV